jgi:hypothetical protein
MLNSALPPWGRASAVLAALLVAVLASATARGAEPRPCLAPGAYTLAATALTGPDATDLELRFAHAAECGAVESVRHVLVETFTQAGRVAQVHNVGAVPLRDGVAAVALPRVERGRRIQVQALVGTAGPLRVRLLRDETVSRLRPDLVVAAVHAPLHALNTRPAELVAEVAEVNGDTPATAHVSVSSGIGPVAGPIEVEVPAGGRVSVPFAPVTFDTAATYTLTFVVDEATPGETDDANNTKTATVEVTTHELARSRLLVQSLGGYGFQYNQHLYAPITSPPASSLPDLETKVKALGSQLVRIFYNENWEANANNAFPEWPANLDSFRRVVQLANDSGATIVIAYQTIATAKTNPTLWMERFADELKELVQLRGLDGVRWVTIANEPNSTTLTLPQYEALYRALDTALRARGLRDHIRLMGGDLVQNSEGTPGGHRAWFDYMVQHMNDVVDAWSEHIYWRYDQPTRMEERLKDVSYLVHAELPESARKPTFLMEYGVRGFDTCGTKPLVKFAYYPDASCTELRRMPLAGFHKLWFSIDAAQLGFDGASDWDLYWSTYDRSNPPNQSFWAIGPPAEGWPLYPSYHALRLLLATTGRGWQVLGIDPWTSDDDAARFDSIVRDGPEQELAAFGAPDGNLTVLGLDTHGGQLTAPTEAKSSYSIGGLPPFTTFTLAVWNAGGDGLDTIAGTIETGEAGVARFEVPLHAAFALTTMPVS